MTHYHNHRLRTIWVGDELPKPTFISLQDIFLLPSLNERESKSHETQPSLAVG